MIDELELFATKKTLLIFAGSCPNGNS